ncbi:MAG: M28 family peptidase [Deltaproteobacteria bacterium]|nr:M28 family peptidase [Deltaproteobacteria bacterium]MBK7064824.1 M28 family peptidase [Deltaproteobacteria bacterium]MBP6829920.1 M28 family peptidase [Deltaproteobacteria bacterium]
MTPPIHSARALVDALCSDACAGRRTNTPGGALARSHIVDALRARGLDPVEQAVPRCNGTNVIATIPGAIDRWVLVGAHYDHLGANNQGVFRGADDNAASVAILVEVAAALAARRPDGRGVILAAFDAEEPPFYATGAMGSQHFVRSPTVPLDRIDMMVAMELLGHGIGPDGLPGAVRDSVFVLGGERSEGTSARLDALADASPGITVRRTDAEVIPPLSDHLAFWEAGVPFLLLTGPRPATYHTPDDTPDRLEWPRIDAISHWLERFVRDQCARPEGRVRFLRDGRDDRSTLDTMLSLLRPLAAMTPLAAQGVRQAEALIARCDSKGRLGEAERTAAQNLVAAIEQALA